MHLFVCNLYNNSKHAKPFRKWAFPILLLSPPLSPFSSIFSRQTKASQSCLPFSHTVFIYFFVYQLNSLLFPQYTHTHDLQTHSIKSEKREIAHNERCFTLCCIQLSIQLSCLLFIFHIMCYLACLLESLYVCT